MVLLSMTLSDLWPGFQGQDSGSVILVNYNCNYNLKNQNNYNYNNN